MKFQRTIMTVGALLLLTVAAQADWDPGDPFKMHYPQLPDPNGWDVAFNGHTLADDFMCTASGEITDVHFWTSWKDDVEDWNSITNIHLSIHSDNPMGPNGWSQPEQLLWEGNFDPGQFIFRNYGDPSEQGWYDPLGEPPVVLPPPNHFGTWQVNITDIQDPFIQQEGTIYWLDIRIDQGENPLGAEIGWKTTQDHWNDDSVIWEDDGQGGGAWLELLDPETGVSLDQAFVVVPEPNVIVMILMSGGGLLFVRRRLML